MKSYFNPECISILTFICLSHLAANINTQTPKDPVPIAEMVTISALVHKEDFLRGKTTRLFPWFSEFCFSSPETFGLI